MIKDFEKIQVIFYSSSFIMEPEPKLRIFSAPAPAKKAGSGSETLVYGKDGFSTTESDRID